MKITHKHQSYHKSEYVTLCKQCQLHELIHEHDIQVDINYNLNIVNACIDLFSQTRVCIEKAFKQTELYVYVLQYTKCLDAFNPSFISRLKFVMEQKHYIPMCRECGCPIDFTYVKPTHAWPSFCCVKHRAVCKMFQKECADRYEAKTGYRHQMLNPTVVKRMQDNYELMHGKGIRCVFQSNEWKDKTRKHIIEKYNVNSTTQLESTKKKAFKTRRRKKYDILCNDSKIKPLFTYENFLEYNRDKQQLWFECKLCGHVFAAYLNHGKDKKTNTYANCPYCKIANIKHGHSHAEFEIVKFIKDIFPNINVQHLHKLNKQIIPPKEIDIILPELKIGIEYNGSYWHRSYNEPIRDYSGYIENFNSNNYNSNTILLKKQLCEKQGYNLIYIYDDEWQYNSVYVKNILISIITKNMNMFKINAPQYISLPYDKFSLNTQIENYTFCKLTPPHLIKRYSWLVWSCGDLIYIRNDILNNMRIDE